MSQEGAHIHVQWEGPYSYDDVCKLNDENTDYGVYQIYGFHPVYGMDVLLYIGKAQEQTFGKRISQQPWWDNHNQDANRLAFYVGRLAGYKRTPNDEIWSELISKIERLLIYAHWPAGNSSGLNTNFDSKFYKLHILNWGQFRALLPEISGARYTNQYDSTENYDVFKRSNQ